MNTLVNPTLRTRTLGLCAGALALAATGSLFAQAVTYNALPGSKVKIEGTSSLHAWDVNGSIVGGSMEVDPKFPDAGTVKPTALAKIPIRTLKSYQKKMDEVMQETMEMAKFPGIEYKLIELKSKGAPKDSKYEFDAVGALTIHGTTITNTMPVTIEKLEGGAKLKVAGKTPLKMTSFGIKPVDVNLVLGHITTGDDVTISIEWMLGRKE
jgi:polyisoprenoid-binding protein YceI